MLSPPSLQEKVYPKNLESQHDRFSSFRHDRCHTALNYIWFTAGLEYEMAQKGGANAKFVDELDRNFLEKKLMKRQFADASQVHIQHLDHSIP